MTIDALLDDVIRREGGYVHHPADRGGCTHYGITLATLAEWRRQPVSCDDVRQLTLAEAREVYRRRYVQAPGFDRVTDPALQALLVDYAVHSGPRRAVEALQRAVGATVDGRLGPQTLAALDRVGPEITQRAVLRLRGEHLAALLQADPTQRVFAAGWLRRLLEFV